MTLSHSMLLYPGSFRSEFKTLDHARGQGAGRFESAAYTAVCEHFERPATPPPGVRRGYETTSNEIQGNRHHSSNTVCGLSTLTLAMGAQDPYTQGHARRVAEYAEGLSQRLGLGTEDIEMIRIGGLLHDIGKIAFSLQLRSNRNTNLTPAMRAEIRRHPQIGVNFLKSIHVAETVIDCVRYHHERLDGSGYPYGLKAAEIPLAARIIGVADCFDALTTDRPYQKGKRPVHALTLMQQWAGRMFSAELVRLLAEEVRANGVRNN